MLDLVTIATTGLTGFFIQSACGGVVGNETHRLYRHALSQLGDDRAERANHDIARTVRLAQIGALERVVAGYTAANDAAWARAGQRQPTDFLTAATTFCRTQRRRARTDPASLALPKAEPLEATIDGLIAPSLAGSQARLKADVISEFAEDAVLAELRAGLSPVAMPDGFAAYLKQGAGPDHPRFLDEFTDDVREAVKSNPRFRDILLVSGIAGLKAQGFEIGEHLHRIEAQFGIDRQDMLGALDRIDESTRRIETGMEKLLRIAEQGGIFQQAAAKGITEASVRAVVERAGGIGVVAEDLIGWLESWIDGVVAERGRRTNERADFNAAQAEAQRRFDAGNVLEASAAFDDEFQREAGVEQERQQERMRRLVRLLEGGIAFDKLALNGDAAGQKLWQIAILSHPADPEAQFRDLLERANGVYAHGEVQGDNASLLIAIGAYRAALGECTRERMPLAWAGLQNNLGNALRTLGARESGTVRLEQAIGACRAALEEWTRERVPLDWAMTQNNLGIAFRALGERETGTARLEQAVEAYHAALEVRTRERVPLDWATTQNNLGNALAALGGRESGRERLQQAVDAFRAALEERTRVRVPLYWATTQNNLGNVLRTLGEREGGTARLEQAAEAYYAALKEMTRERLPLDWAGVQNNLGNVFSLLGEREIGTTRLEQAIEAYRTALEQRTRERVPLQWAATQNNLGSALSRLGERVCGTALLEQAVEACRAALEELTRERVPPDWAAAQNNLGNALRALGERESGTARLEQALAAFNAALTVFVLAPADYHANGCRDNRDGVAALIAARKSIGE